MREMQMKRAALTMLASPCYALGWLARKGWRVVSLFVAAGVQGFQEG